MPDGSSAPGTVLAVRHAQVHNPESLVYARLPGYRLTDEGLEQARELGERLSAKPIRAVFASPLERAVQTAEAIAAPHGLKVLTDERLIEWAFWSEWEGTPWTGLRERAPDVFRKFVDDPDDIWPGEPLREIGGRIVEWSREAAATEGVTIGVSHESPMAAAYLVAAGEPMARFSAIHVPHLHAVRLAPVPPALIDPSDGI
ncbi:MAG: histidine phosphatase family protein [Actinomycetota bacterium]